MKSFRSSLVSLIFVTAATAAETPAVVPLSIEEVLDAPGIAAYSPAALSPDERLIAYVVTDPKRKRTALPDEELMRSGIAWYGHGSDIWVTDVGKATHRNITGGTGHSWAPAWSPDGRYLAFLSARSRGPELGFARLWLWERSSGRLRQAGDADVREGFAGIQWTGDSRSILVSLFPADLGRDGFTAVMEGTQPAVATKETTSSGVTAKVFEFDPSDSKAVPQTDQMNLDIFRRDLGLVDVQTGKLRVVSAGRRIGAAVLSPDGSKLAYAVLDRAEKPGGGQYLYEIVSHDLRSNEKRVVAKDVKLSLLAGSFSWSPDSKTIAYRTGGPTADDEVHVAGAESGAPRLIAKNPPDDALRFEIDPPVWDAAGRNVYFLRGETFWRAPVDASGAKALATLTGKDVKIIAPRQHRLFTAGDDASAVLITLDRATKNSGFARVNVETGAVTQLSEKPQRFGGYGTEGTIASDGESLALVVEDALHPPDIYIASGRNLELRRVSQVTPALTGRSFGRAEPIEWRGIDGGVQYGALVYPAGYEKGKKYPLIVKVYGGSAISNDLNRFGYASGAIENLQIYATRGYAILLADSKANVGTPMVDLMKTVMPGINEVIEKGVADPDRIGVTGHSYGGYSTLSLIAQSPRFKAAVMRAGFGNLIGGYGHLAPDGTNYGLAWAESGQGRMGGNPWEFRERYLENSPIFYLHRVETPLLIIHGTDDDAVPVFLADEIFTALRRLAKPVTYVRYEDEGHWEGSWSYPNQLDALRRSIAWFDRHLKPN